MQYQLGIIGTGEFAGYLLHGFMRRNPRLTAILSPRGRTQAGELARRYGHRIARDNAEVAQSAETILAATRPAQLSEALAGLPWRRDQLVISVAAGVRHAELRALVDPADAVLCMPTNSAMFGASVVPLFPGNPRAVEFLSALGEPFVMPDEHAFESSAVLGAMYGWLLELMATGIDWLEVHDVPPDAARGLMSRLFASVGEVGANRGERTVEQLVDELRLPGGITEHGLIEFERRGSMDDWQAVMTEILERLHHRY